MATIITYYEQLDRLARKGRVDLLGAFEEAHLPTSTFYRARKGIDMRASTAVRVAEAITALTRKP